MVVMSVATHHKRCSHNCHGYEICFHKWILLINKPMCVFAMSGFRQGTCPPPSNVQTRRGSQRHRPNSIHTIQGKPITPQPWFAPMPNHLQGGVVARPSAQRMRARERCYLFHAREQISAVFQTGGAVVVMVRCGIATMSRIRVMVFSFVCRMMGGHAYHAMVMMMRHHRKPQQHTNRYGNQQRKQFSSHHHTVHTDFRNSATNIVFFPNQNF